MVYLNQLNKPPRKGYYKESDQMNKPTQNMHYGFDIKQAEMFPVTVDEINVELEEQSKYQDDDVCFYI